MASAPTIPRVARDESGRQQFRAFDYDIERGVELAKSLGSDRDLTSVDVAAVTAQLSTYQAQLTASYAAISKVQSLDLASYLP